MESSHDFEVPAIVDSDPNSAVAVKQVQNELLNELDESVCFICSVLLGIICRLLVGAFTLFLFT